MASAFVSLEPVAIYNRLSYETLLRERAQCMTRIANLNKENQNNAKSWASAKNCGQLDKAARIVTYGQYINFELLYEADTLELIERTLCSKLYAQKN